MWVDGTQVLQQTVADLPPVADLVFTAATGGLTDNFDVQNVNICHSTLSNPSNWSLNGNAQVSGSTLDLTNGGHDLRVGLGGLAGVGPDQRAVRRL